MKMNFKQVDAERIVFGVVCLGVMVAFLSGYLVGTRVGIDLGIVAGIAVLAFFLGLACFLSGKFEKLETSNKESRQ
jgi:hypothetical protein